jgi:hypothetical protein
MQYENINVRHSSSCKQHHNIGTHFSANSAENRVQRKIFGPKMDEEIGESTKQRNDGVP